MVISDWSMEQNNGYMTQVDSFCVTPSKAQSMAAPYLCCDKCGRTLKTFQALLQHLSQRHAYKQLPKRALFTDGEQEIKRITPLAIRSPVIQAEYKAWLVGVTERINGIHHLKHKSKLIR